MRNFRKLNIWQDGIELVKTIYAVSNKLPDGEKYGITSQISRSVISIPSNIAEGSNRSSELEFKRFLEMAPGSVFELESPLIIAAGFY